MKTGVITKSNINTIVTVLSRNISTDYLRTVFYTLSCLLDKEPQIHNLSRSKSLYIKLKDYKGIVRLSDHRPVRGFRGVWVNYKYDFYKIEKVLEELG